MKWTAIIAGGVALVVAAIVAIGSMLPRTHKASRTLTVRRPPADVWPVVIQATETSDVPVDVLERNPPHRLVTRVTEKEKNFGGTWTIDIAPVPSGSAVTVTEDGRERHRKKRRSRRREHRQRNPTLSQTGGLPPPRDPEQSPTI